jgi:AcrR family transcriptional regulator
MGARTYTQVARRRSEELTKSRLLDAATRVFFEEDWAGTSLERIAAEADVSKQTLLRHFGSREGLAKAAFERERTVVVSQRAAAPVGDVPGAVDNLLDHYEAFGDRALKLEALPPDAAGSEFVQEGRELHYQWVETVFGPLLGRSARVRRRRLAALIAICDVHTWRLLARHLGLGRAEVRATLMLAIDGVLEEAA